MYVCVYVCVSVRVCVCINEELGRIDREIMALTSEKSTLNGGL